jgi:hypothetical protein
VETFIHSGEVKVSRKTGEFVPIVPLTRSDLSDSSGTTATLEDTVAGARALRERLEEQLVELAEETKTRSRSLSEEE